MSCFLACFGASKDEKHQKIARKVPSDNPNLGYQFEPISVSSVAEKEDNPEKPINLVAESRGKAEEQLSSGTRKKVTFDSNVKEYDHVSVDEAPGNIQDSEIGVNQNFTTLGESPSLSESGYTVSSLGLYPPNHRYQNCRESDDDEEELDYEVSDLDEDEDGHDEGDEEEVYDDEYCDDDCHPRNEKEFSTVSCSSLESRTKSPATHEVNVGLHDPLSNSLSPEIKTNTPRFNHSARDRTGYIYSVLNPVENTTQWRIVKTKGTPPLKQKENIQIDSKFELLTMKSRSKLDEPKSNNEVAVDASLSNWLVSSQKTPTNKATPIDLEPISSGASMSSHGSNTVRSQERPILGALTVEELKQFSASSTPRKSPSRSLDVKPIVGTVGAHWNDRTPTEDSVSTSSFKGIPNTTSKYKEDNRVNWHSTPFEKRLERALNSGTAEAYASHHAC